MAEIGAFFLAGLAFFFTGLAGIKANLSQLTGRRFRALLLRMTHRPVVAVFLGVLCGAVTQSASAVAFILSGMVTTGLVQMRQILPVLAASNVGTVVLVFLASISLKLAILYVVGITGILIAFEVAGARGKPAFGALFSIGLLFYGLDLMKAAFAPLPGLAWFGDLAAFLATWPFAPFVLGMFLRVLIQSSSAISVIAITLLQGGLFNEFQASMLIAGTGPGAGLAAYLLSSRLTGVPRQVVIFQALTNTAAGLVACALLGSEFLVGYPGVASLIDHIPGGSDRHLACLFLGLMIITFLIGLLIQPIAPALLEKLAPTTLRESLSKPKYLLDDALAIPETALSLASKEQGRFSGMIPKLLANLLTESERYPAPPSGELHAAATLLHREIAIYVKELLRRPQSAALADQVLRVDRVQDTLDCIAQNVFKFASLAPACRATGPLLSLYSTMADALHTMLLTLEDVFCQDDPMDLEFLHTMSEDRGALMERIQKTYLEHPEITSVEDRSSLLFATSLFSRIVWMTHHVTAMLGAETGQSADAREVLLEG